MALDAKLVIETVKEKTGALGELLYDQIYMKGWVMDFKDYTEKLTDDEDALESLLKYMKKRTFEVEFTSCIGCAQGDYALWVDFKLPGMLCSHTHFDYKGSWEGAEKELKKHISVLVELGFKINYKGYNKERAERIK